MIHMNNVTKVYPNGSTGVENINLLINKGELYSRWVRAVRGNPR